jgi:hypothetical protein
MTSLCLSISEVAVSGVAQVGNAAPGTFKLTNWLHHPFPFPSSLLNKLIHHLCQKSFCILFFKGQL